MAGPDLSTLTVVIDFDTIVIAVTMVYASVVVLYLTIKGINILLSAIGGRDRQSSQISEGEYRSVWANMTDDEKDFFNVSSYQDWRSRYTVE